MSEGDWFFCPPSYSFEEAGYVARIAKQTEQRVYFGEVRASWGGRRNNQSYVDKRKCIAIGVSEEVARAISSAWADAKRKKDGAHKHYAEQIRKIEADRDAAISAILAPGMK